MEYDYREEQITIYPDVTFLICDVQIVCNPCNVIDTYSELFLYICLTSQDVWKYSIMNPKCSCRSQYIINNVELTAKQTCPQNLCNQQRNVILIYWFLTFFNVTIWNFRNRVRIEPILKFFFCCRFTCRAAFFV